MKLIKCRKCGATIMTDDTLLTAMQEEYNALVKRSHRAKGADKQLIAQQLKHLHKMMVAICHSTSEMETRKNAAYNELQLLKKHIIANNLIDFETLDRFRDEARTLSRTKAAEDEKKIAEVYGEFVNTFCNRTKSDPTATEAMRGSVKGERKNHTGSHRSH